MQSPHIAAQSRNSDEAGTVIDQLFEHCRVKLLLTRQIDQNAWI
jgi:hypothetical protein